jgi:hypothetical protein
MGWEGLCGIQICQDGQAGPLRKLVLLGCGVPAEGRFGRVNPGDRHPGPNLGPMFGPILDPRWTHVGPKKGPAETLVTKEL